MVLEPNRQTAEAELEKAAALYPGQWVGHSRYVARACENIARAAGMDSDKAYVLGLLHDIGRCISGAGQRHIFSGWQYCREHGWEEVARICLTHSFLLEDLTKGVSAWNGTQEEYDTVCHQMQSYVLNDYDYLVQLADCLGLARGFVILERRMVDVAMRYGFLKGTLEKWQRLFDLKKYFDTRCGTSIYNLLPGIKGNLDD